MAVPIVVKLTKLRRCCIDNLHSLAQSTNRPETLNAATYYQSEATKRRGNAIFPAHLQDQSSCPGNSSGPGPPIRVPNRSMAQGRSAPLSYMIRAHPVLLKAPYTSHIHPRFHQPHVLLHPSNYFIQLPQLGHIIMPPTANLSIERAPLASHPQIHLLRTHPQQPPKTPAVPTSSKCALCAPAPPPPNLPRTLTPSLRYANSPISPRAPSISSSGSAATPGTSAFEEPADSMDRVVQATERWAHSQDCIYTCKTRF